MKTAALHKGDTALIATVEVADRLFERMAGLMGRKSLARDCALYLAPCNSIHTFFMRFPLDVIFLDRDFQVCSAVRYVLPNRMVWGGRRARAVLEIESGWLPASALRAGDRVTLVEKG